MTTKEKIIEAIEEIPEEKLPEVLSMLEDMRNKGKAKKSAGKWDRFFGILSHEEADAMLAVIEETCERIDYE